MDNYKCKSVGIIGSGIQGVCTGLQLIKKGIPVTLFDRHDPLSQEFKSASYGNAESSLAWHETCKEISKAETAMVREIAPDPDKLAR